MKTKGTKSKKIKLPYGEGSIYYVESRKRYSGQINLVIDGERVRKTVYGKTERETRNKLKEEISIMRKNSKCRLFSSMLRR